MAIIASVVKNVAGLERRDSGRKVRWVILIFVPSISTGAKGAGQGAENPTGLCGLTVCGVSWPRREEGTWRATTICPVTLLCEQERSR